MLPYKPSHGFSEYNEYNIWLASIISDLWAAEIAAALHEICYTDLRYGSTCPYVITEHHVCKSCALIVSEKHIFSDARYS